MRIAYTPEQERLRRELRAYFAGLMTPEVRAALSPSDNGAGGGEGLGGGEADRQVVRPLEEVGGRGAGRADRAGAPGRAHPDLRRRHQRGAAGHHRGGGAQPARAEEGLMDFT